MRTAALILSMTLGIFQTTVAPMAPAAERAKTPKSAKKAKAAKRAPEGTRSPADWAPGDAAVWASVNDVRPLLEELAATLGKVEAQKAAQRPSKKARASGKAVKDAAPPESLSRLLDEWSHVLSGPIALSVFIRDGDVNRVPIVLVRADLAAEPAAEPESLDDLVQRTAVLLLEMRDAKPVEGPIRGLKGRGSDAVYWLVRDGALYLSDEPSRVEAKTAAGGALAGSDAFKALSKHVDWSGEVVAFADLSALFWKAMVSEAEARRAAKRVGFEDSMVAWLRPEQFRAAGLSWSATEDGGSGRLAVLAGPAGPGTGPRQGLGEFLSFPNEAPRHLDRLPEASWVVQWITPTGKGLVGRLEKLAGQLDPDIAKEFRDELAEFCQELGVDLGKDFLDNAGSGAVGASLGAEGGPTVWYVQEVADESRFEACAEALARFNGTPIRKEREAELDLYALDLGSREAFYALAGGRLVASTDRSSVGRMLARPEGFRSVADSETFSKLRRRLPETCVLLWALDLRSTAQFFAPLLLGSAALGADASLAGDLMKALQPIFKAEKGLSLGIALRDEPDAFVISIETLGVDPWKMAPGLVRVLVSLGSARSW